MTDIPISEQYRIAAAKWVDREAAACLLEDLKSAVLAQRMAELGDIPVSRAETTVKASRNWHDHVTKIAEARKAANQAKVELEYLRMRFSEWQNSEANARMEAKLL